ncbi:hypothetical protein [Pseudaminobacter salicylatoxidans]|uniref:hypothetical protein n=1 Tax=Pseudaminobacter salicylatoxidans TaxID=93369 RepID=UPI0012F6BC37|nr:hypothetical protein [Pseudaminobacter salicylatoxidans]
MFFNLALRIFSLCSSKSTISDFVPNASIFLHGHRKEILRRRCMIATVDLQNSYRLRADPTHFPCHLMRGNRRQKSA